MLFISVICKELFYMKLFPHFADSLIDYTSEIVVMYYYFFTNSPVFFQNWYLCTIYNVLKLYLYIKSEFAGNNYP